jgi:outer membrane protein
VDGVPGKRVRGVGSRRGQEMNRHRVRTILLAGTLFSAGLMPGFAPSVARAESLADAMVKAYQTSPLLDANRAALRSVDEGVPQARSARRPQVSFGVGASTSTTSEDFQEDQLNQVQAQLEASLVFFDSGSTKAAIESARNQVAAGRADLKDVEQLILFNAVQAYCDVRRDEEFVRLATNDVERLNETLRATQNRFDVGEVTRTDVSQSQSRYAESRAQLESARGALEISRETYRQAVGTLPDNLEQLPPLPPLPKSVDEAIAIGMQRNPSIVSAQFAERAAVYDFDRARAAKGLQISGTVAAGPERQNQQGWDPNMGVSAGISASVPLYTGGLNDSVIRQAQALLDQRRFQLQDEGRTVTQSVAAAWSQFQVSTANIVARREQAEAARIAAEGVAEEARLGARSTLDVLDADQERLQAEAEIVQAVRDEYVAAYSLLRATGLLTVEHLKLGIETYNPDVYYTKVQSGPSGGYDTSAVDRIRARWER